MLSFLSSIVCLMSSIQLARSFSQTNVKASRLRSLTSNFRLRSSLIETGLNAKDKLKSCIKNSLLKSFGDVVIDVNPVIEAASKSEFGDYQCNIAMPLAKKLKMKPREIASKLIDAMETTDILSDLDIAGPGFINMRLSQSFIKDQLKIKLSDPLRLGISPATHPQRVVIDFSSPNIAKEMHVGHLRSTIIGDCLARLLEFLGHDVLRLNHVGDWGTQFGMLIRHLKETAPDALKAPETATGEEKEKEKDAISVSIGDLAQFYKDAKKHFDNDPEFQINSRLEVVKLQSGDADSLRVWRAFCQCSRVEFEKIYKLLNVTLIERGESFYNPLLADIVSTLKEKELAVESNGAQVVYLEGYKNRAGESLPLMISKSDGGFLYATTDLAAVRHRVVEEKADRILYVTDAGQSQHFQMVFDTARTAGWINNHIELKHVPFGVVQGEDGQKLKSRSGETVKLKDLLFESIRLVDKDIKSRKQTIISTTIETEKKKKNDDDNIDSNSDSDIELTEEEEQAVLAVAIGAVKYADLSMNRESDYRFSYSKMLALTGNTAPYMLYAYARIQGIRRRGEEQLKETGDSLHSSYVQTVMFSLDTPEEMMLARTLLRVEDVLRDVESSLYPNKICEYLFDLSQKFNQFYEQCPVLRAETKELQRSRTALCSITADTLSVCLGLLGIRTVEKL